MPTTRHATAVAPERSGDGQAGSISVELALVASLLALMAFGLVQLAFFGYAREAAGYAAHDALTEATAYDGSPAVGQDFGAQMLAQLTSALKHPRITVRENGNQAVVTVTGQSAALFGIAQTVTVTDTGEIQRFGTGT